MKCTIPEISWHNRDPVLSVDVQSTKNGMGVFHRLATGGTDSHVVIWYITVKECGLASVEVAADLQRHQRAVNTVRFSPSGQYLASGDDESVIIVWKPKTEHDISELSSTDNEVSKEQWVSMKTLRGHLEDVYDLCWSLDSTHLISGSIDNTAIVWDVQKGRNLGILSGHGGFVQGVAWDPKNKYVATLSSDRTCRIHNIFTKKLSAKISKTTLPVPPGTELDGKIMRLFHDDTLKSFFRRLSFSPDGELLIVPSGVIEIPNTEKHINATYIFVRYDFSRPVVYLPSPHEYTVAVRFCPLLFKLHEGSSLFALPYRMVFAVATKSNVILYDTQQPEPIAFISNIHYTRLTDLSWSSDGRVLVASSTDGYCSIITFSDKELGDVYEPPNANPENEYEFQNCENKQASGSCRETGHQESSASKTASCDDQGCEEEGGAACGDEFDGKVPVRDISTPQTPSVAEVTKNKIDNASARSAPETKSRRRIPLITLSSPRKHTTTGETVLKNSSVENLQEVSSTSNSDFGNKEGIPEKSKEDSKIIAKESISLSIDSSTIMEKIAAGRESTENLVESMQTEETTSVNTKIKENVDLISEREEGDKSVDEVEDSTACVKKETAAVGEVPSLESSEAAMEVDVIAQPEVSSCIDNVDENIKDEFSSACAVSNSHNVNTSSINLSSEAKEETLSIQNSCIDTTINTGKNLENREHYSPIKEKNGENSNANINNIGSAHEKSPARVSTAKLLCETTPSKCSVHEMEQSGTPSSVKVSDEVSQQQEVQCSVTPVENRTPRRVQFITISSPKSKKKLL